MRFSLLLAALVSATRVLAADLIPFQNLKQVLRRSSDLSETAPLLRRDICSQNGYKVCGNSCMPLTASCCDADGDFCHLGDVCSSGGCCPVGKRCVGTAGTSTYDLTLRSSATANPVAGGGSSGSGISVSGPSSPVPPSPTTAATAAAASSSAAGFAFSVALSRASSSSASGPSSVSGAGAVAVTAIGVGATASSAGVAGPAQTTPARASGAQGLAVLPGPVWAVGAVAVGMMLL